MNIQRTLTGIKYGLIFEGFFFLLQMILFFINQNYTFQTFEYFFFIFGGIYLTISGCIGPGGYRKDYQILLYSPTSGNSFSNKIEVMGFVTNFEIIKADIIVNEKQIEVLEFDSEGRGVLVIEREDFDNLVINNIYLKSGSRKSNRSEFTLFEYRENMDEDELEELYQMELNQKQEKTLKEAQDSYIKRKNNKLGSIAFGIFILSLLNFGLSVLFSIL